MASFNSCASSRLRMSAAKAINSFSTCCLVPRDPTTVTLNPQELLLPDELLAVQLTLVIPIGNTLPDGVVQINVVGVQLVETVGVNVTDAPAWLVNSIAMSGGQMRPGGVGSITVTLAVQEFDAPWLSVTLRVTGVVPNEYGPGGDWIIVIGSPSGS